MWQATLHGKIAWNGMTYMGPFYFAVSYILMQILVFNSSCGNVLPKYILNALILYCYDQFAFYSSREIDNPIFHISHQNFNFWCRRTSLAYIRLATVSYNVYWRFGIKKERKKKRKLPTENNFSVPWVIALKNFMILGDSRLGRISKQIFIQNFLSFFYLIFWSHHEVLLNCYHSFSGKSLMKIWLCYRLYSKFEK